MSSDQVPGPQPEASEPSEVMEAEPGPQAEEALSVDPVEDPDTHRFECRSCGFVYDPDEGVRKLAIAPGTRCQLC